MGRLYTQLTHPWDEFTSLTDEDISDGIADEYGVVYSVDGKRLLRSVSSLEHYRIKDGTETICDDAFHYIDIFDNTCAAINTLIIPPSVTNIGRDVFLGCGNLKTIYIPQGTRTTYERLLEEKYHYALKELMEPSTTVTEEDIKNGIKDEYGVVYSADGSRLLKCANTSLEYYQIKYGTISICDSAFYADGDEYGNLMTKLKCVIIPDSVTSIGDGAFRLCSSLKSIVIPDSIRNIGDYAFSGCPKLNCINLPCSISRIGNRMFEGCVSLRHIYIPKSVTNIGHSSFEYCTSLKSIVIPASVINIGQDAFAYCPALSFIHVDKCNPIYVSHDNNIIVEKQSKTLVIGCKNSTIPTSVSIIGANAFKGSFCLSEIEFPNSIIEIGKNAFRDCRSLISVKFSATIKSVGDYAFIGCRSLKFIDIPVSVTSIGSCAFVGCHSIESISLPASLKSISNDCFRDCRSLSSINIPYSVTCIEKNAFYGCDGLKSLELPFSVAYLGETAFGYCRRLTSVKLPFSLKSIETNTFSDCFDLESISVDEHNPIFESLNCNVIVERHTHTLVLGCKGSIIPSSVKRIGECAFANCIDLEHIIIPSSVTSIGAYAFSGCSNLKHIEIPASITSIEESAFADDSYCWLDTVIFRGAVKYIDSLAFGIFGSLSISIPKGTRLEFDYLSSHIIIKEYD